MNGVTDTQTQLQVLICQTKQHLKDKNPVFYQTRKSFLDTYQLKFYCTQQVKHKGTACTKAVPCHFWRFQSRPACTWASPWQPPARPGLHLPSTVTCMCFEWALPAGGGPAAPHRQTGSAVCCCQSLDWSGEVMVWHTGVGSGSEGYRNQRNDSSEDRLTWKSEGRCPRIYLQSGSAHTNKEEAVLLSHSLQRASNKDESFLIYLC